MSSKATETPIEDPPEPSNEPEPPPDGGLRAWTQVLAAHFINALTWGSPASFGVYQLYYTETLRLPPSQISWVGSLQLFLTFFLCTFSGRGADAGYARELVGAGLSLILVGTFMTSLCTKYWQILLAQGICMGVGMGTAFMPAVAVVGTYFSTKKSMALALGACGSALGSMAFPATVQYLTPQIGFPWAVRCSGLIALFLAVMVMLLLRPRKLPRKGGPIVDWAAFREPAYLLFSLGIFLVFWSLYFGFFYVNAYAKDIIGLSNVQSVSLLLIINAVGMPVRPILGFIADRYTGPINTLIMSSTFLGVMFYIWIGITSRTSLYVFAVLYGIATGAAQGIFVGALASLTKDLSKTGVRFGMVCSLLGFATLTGPPIAGALIQSEQGSYVAAQIWAGTTTLVGTVTIGLARIYETGWTLRAKK